MPPSDRFLLHQHRFVQAGAGTGKTHALVTQYLHLCAGLALDFRPVLPTDIVVLTFTEKAAYELRERILARITRLLHALQTDAPWQADEPALYATAQSLQKTLPPLTWWHQAQEALYDASIGTFHTFAHQLVTSHAVALGLDPTSQLLDESVAYTLYFQATCQTIRKGLQGLLPSVTANDTAALVAEYGFTGTSMAPALVENLIHVGTQQREGNASVQPDPSLLLTTAWQEAQQSLRQQTRHLLELAPTLSPASQSLLLQECFQQDIPHVPFSSSQELLDNIVGQWMLRHEILSSLRAPPRSETALLLAETKKHFRHSFETLQALKASVGMQSYARTFAALCENSKQAYQTAKQTRPAWDFTDLLQQALQVFSLPNEQGSLAPFRAVLVDESQDTNALQAQLVQQLVWKQTRHVEGAWPESTQETKLYMVGDRKQSIYQFRGAHGGLFQEMKTWFQERQGQEETLNRSYRATPALVSFTNAFFANAFQNHPQEFPSHATLWDPSVDSLVAARTNPTEGLVAEWVQAPHEMTPSLFTEAALLALRLQQWHQEGHPWSDMVILLRRFTHIRTYTAKLQEAGIPLAVFQSRGLFQQPEIQDMVAALRLLVDPTDRWSWLVLLRSPFCACRDSTLLQLQQQQIFSLSDWLHCHPKPSSLPTDDTARIERMALRLDALRPYGYQVPPSTLLTILCQEFQLWDIWQALPSGEQQARHAWQLIEYARQCEPEQRDVRSFVHRLNRIMDPEGLAPEPIPYEEAGPCQGVRIMTIHQAKGLEFPMVAIPGCGQPERYPTARISYTPSYGVGFSRKNNQQAVHDFVFAQNERWHRAQVQAESLRLLYVAVTRAQHRVLFVGETHAAAPCWRHLLEKFSHSPEGHLLHSVVLTPPSGSQRHKAL